MYITYQRQSLLSNPYNQLLAFSQSFLQTSVVDYVSKCIDRKIILDQRCLKEIIHYVPTT